MTRRCIFYVSDKNYFFPTIVSALTSRRMCLPDTKVLVFMSESMGLDAEKIRSLKEGGVDIVDSTDFLTIATKDLSRKSFHGPISVTAMGRLLADDLLDKCFDEAIYLDGDTLVAGALLPLEELAVPQGGFAAALDYLSLIPRMAGKPYENYINSGVLKFNPGNWPGREAFNLFLEFPERPYHDQGALNTVGRGCITLISNRWNFPKQFLHLLCRNPALENAPENGTCAPEIIHFMSHPKPWHGHYFPFSHAHLAEYSNAVGLFPWLGSFWSQQSIQRKILYRFRSLRDTARHSFAGRDRMFDIKHAFIGPWQI